MAPEYIHPGDRVIDPLDLEVRTVERVWDTTVFLIDGGAMNADEIDRVYLPSERIE